MSLVYWRAWAPASDCRQMDPLRGRPRGWRLSSTSSSTACGIQKCARASSGGLSQEAPFRLYQQSLNCISCCGRVTGVRAPALRAGTRLEPWLDGDSRRLRCLATPELAARLHDSESGGFEPRSPIQNRETGSSTCWLGEEDSNQRTETATLTEMNGERTSTKHANPELRTLCVLCVEASRISSRRCASRRAGPPRGRGARPADRSRTPRSEGDARGRSPRPPDPSRRTAPPGTRRT